MALTVEDAITAIVNQANTLAGTSTAEDLVYLAKSLEAVSDTRQASDEAIQAVVNQANALSDEATAEDLIYLAKAVEALSVGSTMADIAQRAHEQVARIGASVFELELRNVSLEYNEFGDVAKITETLPDGASRTSEFVYSPSGQVSSAQRSFEGYVWTEFFSYDSFGNVSTISITEGPAQ